MSITKITKFSQNRGFFAIFNKNGQFVQGNCYLSQKSCYFARIRHFSSFFTKMAYLRTKTAIYHKKCYFTRIGHFSLFFIKMAFLCKKKTNIYHKKRKFPQNWKFFVILYKNGVFMQVNLYIYHKNHLLSLELSIFRYFSQKWHIFVRKLLSITIIKLYRQNWGFSLYLTKIAYLCEKRLFVVKIALSRYNRAFFGDFHKIGAFKQENCYLKQNSRYFARIGHFLCYLSGKPRVLARKLLFITKCKLFRQN